MTDPISSVANAIGGVAAIFGPSKVGTVAPSNGYRSGNVIIIGGLIILSIMIITLMTVKTN